MNSKISQEKIELLGKIVLLLVVFIIVSVRLKTFFLGSSLMIDEANVARNIAERGFLQLWQNLDYEQYAPPLYLTIVKISTLTFGMNEYALRLPALLASLASIYLLIKLCRHPSLQLNNWYISIVLILFGSSYIMITQSNMLKQYSSDAMFVLFFVFMAVKNNYKDFLNVSGILLWTIFGLVGIWFSMPVVFVLAAVGIYFFKQSIDANECEKFMLYFSFPSLIWILNFFLYFFFLLKSDAESSYLQSYHDRFFLDAQFWQWEAWVKNWKIIENILQTYIGKTTIEIAWFLVFLAAGKMYLYKHNKGLFILLLLPFTFAALASLLHYYSFISRLLLFTMPLLFVVLAVGFRWLWNHCSNYLNAIFVLATLFVIVKMNPVKYLIPGNVCVVEETREVLDQFEIGDYPNINVFVNHEGVPALTFYTQYYDGKEKYTAYKGFTPIYWDENLVQKTAYFLQQNPNKRLVVIWGHTANSTIKKDIVNLQKMGFKIEKNVEKARARAVEWSVE